MEELLKVLEQLYAEEGNSIASEYGDEEYFVESELRDEAEGLCNECLITNGGQCNWDNIHKLRSNGYLVFAGEKDSFGWLTGCVQKRGDQRVLVYG